MTKLSHKQITLLAIIALLLTAASFLFRYAPTRVSMVVHVLSQIQGIGGEVLGWLFVPVFLLLLVFIGWFIVDVAKHRKEEDPIDKIAKRLDAIDKSLAKLVSDQHNKRGKKRG